MFLIFNAGRASEVQQVVCSGAHGDALATCSKGVRKVDAGMVVLNCLLGSAI